MKDSALTMSLRPIGPGAAWATTVSASLVSSDARSTASTTSMWPSSPSTDASQRRTLRRISSWVSPSNVRLAIAVRLVPELAAQDELQARPDLVDGAHLGVDPTGREQHVARRLLGHVRGYQVTRRLLRPRHPQRAPGPESPGQRRPP